MMKTTTLRTLAATTLAGCLLLSAARAAEGENAVQKKITVSVSGDGTAPKAKEHRMMFTTVDSANESDAEPKGFLGIESTRADSTLREQLGLPRGVGLVVQRVVPDTAAAAVLQKHDILTKLGDQLLVSADQLGILVSSKAPGTEVTLTLLRGGKEQTITLALGERKKSAARVFEFRGEHGGPALTPERLKDLHGSISKEEVERLLEHVKAEKMGGSDGFKWVGEGNGPVVRMLNVNRGNVVFSDESGMVELKSGGDTKVLVVKGSDGTVLFDGPVSTEEERSALSEAVKSRLEKVETIRQIDMTPGAEFETEEVHVISGGETTAMAPAAGTAKTWVEADSSL